MINSRKHYIWYIPLILSAIGSINWGLIVVAKLNFVEYLFGSPSMAANIMYMLVGTSGLYILYEIFKEIFVEKTVIDNTRNKI